MEGDSCRLQSESSCDRKRDGSRSDEVRHLSDQLRLSLHDFFFSPLLVQTYLYLSYFPLNPKPPQPSCLLDAATELERSRKVKMSFVESHPTTVELNAVDLFMLLKAAWGTSEKFTDFVFSQSAPTNKCLHKEQVSVKAGSWMRLISRWMNG